MTESIYVLIGKRYQTNDIWSDKKVQQFNKPTNSNNEDITINVLSVDFDQLREGIGIINLFVPNTKFNVTIEGKDVVLTDILDQLRINKLLGDLKVILKHHYDDDKYILVELMEQTIHYVRSKPNGCNLSGKS